MNRPGVDRKRIAEVAAKVEASDPQWRDGKPAFSEDGVRGHRRTWVIRPVIQTLANGSQIKHRSIGDAARAARITDETMSRYIAGRIKTPDRSSWDFAPRQELQWS